MLLGVNVSPSVEPEIDPVASAVRAEELGFDFLSVNDHLHGPSPRFETWTLLSWIAARTSRIRVLPRVLGVPYRHPTVLAKMAETLSRLSNGRLILGLGGGASDDEFRAFGLGVRQPREKVTGLEEAVHIIRGTWAQPTFTFRGRLYRTEAAELQPKPEHPIPIWLGTFGPRALEVTGRLADGWIPSLDMAPPDRVGTMRARVLDAAREVGRDPDRITCAYNLEFRIQDPPLDEPHVVSGSTEAVASRLADFADMGFTAFNFIPIGPAEEDQVAQLAVEVLPALRQAVG